MSSGAATRAPAVRVTAPVRGEVILPDDGSPVGLYAWLTSASHTDSVAVEATGSFTLPIDGAHCGPSELRIGAAAGAERRYHPVIVRLDGGDQRPRTARQLAARRDTTGLRIVLVPTRIVIDAGTYAGIVVPIHVDAALAGSWEHTRFWRVTRTAREGFGTPVAWPETFFPIPVVLRARGGVRSADSASFWRAARQLEADVGRSLFQPVADERGTEEIWKIIVAIEPTAHSAAITYVTYDMSGAIYETTIAIRSAMFLNDARLVTHELMHALGFGHATAWPSVTAASLIAPSRATATDVAYAQLLYRLRRAHLAESATHGVLASSAEGRRTVSGRASQCAQ